MKIDKKNINRLLCHLNNQRVLSAKLVDSHAKDLIDAEIRGMELAILILGIEVD